MLMNSNDLTILTDEECELLDEPLRHAPAELRDNVLKCLRDSSDPTMQELMRLRND